MLYYNVSKPREPLGAPSANLRVSESLGAFVDKPGTVLRISFGFITASRLPGDSRAAVSRSEDHRAGNPPRD